MIKFCIIGQKVHALVNRPKLTI